MTPAAPRGLLVATTNPGKLREIRALLTQSRSIDYARWKATEYVEHAKKALYVFPPSEARDALMYLPDYVISRDR